MLTGHFKTNSEGETARLAERLARGAGAGDVFCLSGAPGAGKTAFAKGFAAGLGVPGHVTSPTFTILNVYRGAVPLYHFDLYRINGVINGGAALYDTGFYDYLNADGVCLIEWPENAAGQINCPVTLVTIAQTGHDDNMRTIDIAGLSGY